MIIGGQAVLIYGEPRLTKDIDITLGVGIEKLSVIKDTVRTLGLSIEADDVDSFVKDTMVLPATDPKNGIRVDFVFSFSPFERAAIERAHIAKFDEISVRFASLEDLVIHKIVAGRARDIEDVRAILLKNPGYDRDHIESWLSDFDKSIDGGFLSKFDELVSELTREAGRKLSRLGGTAKDLQPIRRRKSRP